MQNIFEVHLKAAANAIKKQLKDYPAPITANEGTERI